MASGNVFNWAQISFRKVVEMELKKKKNATTTTMTLWTKRTYGNIKKATEKKVYNKIAVHNMENIQAPAELYIEIEK